MAGILKGSRQEALRKKYFECEPKNPNSAWELTKLFVGIAFWFYWALVLGTIGVALCCTGILFMPGMAVLALAAMPLKRMMERRGFMLAAWEARHNTHADVKAPWEEED